MPHHTPVATSKNFAQNRRVLHHGRDSISLASPGGLVSLTGVTCGLGIPEAVDDVRSSGTPGQRQPSQRRTALRGGGASVDGTRCALRGMGTARAS